MKIKDFIKMNKSIIITFLVFEIVLYGGFYLNLKLELRVAEYNDYSEVDINSQEALEVVKSEHEEWLQGREDRSDYGYIKEIKYTHDYETYNGEFYTIIIMDNGHNFLYGISEDMKCVVQKYISFFEYSQNGNSDDSYDTKVYDIVFDSLFKQNIRDI